MQVLEQAKLNASWQNFGDVNWMIHNGTFVQKDECGYYHVVQFINHNSDFDSTNVDVNTAHIDLNDSWIDWDSIASYNGFSKNELDETDTHQKAMLVMEYYGAIHCNGETHSYTNLSSALEHLNDLEIMNEPK